MVKWKQSTSHGGVRMRIRQVSKRYRRHAVVAILFLVTLPVLFGMAALTIDMGLAYNARADLQDAADAADTVC